nr:calcium-transporting ATPase 2, plasma membrane-type-like [Tanacetum cinerariifolium]
MDYFQRFQVKKLAAHIALHEADIGLAMGIVGTEVAKESADMIVLYDNFSKIVTIVKWDRLVYDNIQKFQVKKLAAHIALHEADIGLAMGIVGTEVAKESADTIVLYDNFSTIVTIVKWDRLVYDNIQNLLIRYMVSGSAPLTAVQLLWVNMIMDTFGALALATEPPTDELMERTPVGRKENFITNVMWRNIMGQSLFQFVVICSKEMEKIDVFKGILENYLFLAVVTATAIFQIIIIESLGTFANTSPLTLPQWFASVVIGFLGN